MKLRKRIITEARRQNEKTRLTKALAMLLFYHIKVDENQVALRAEGITHDRISNFSYNKIRKVTGLHHNTIRTRLQTAINMGWARIQGGNLVIDSKALRSSHLRNNYTIPSGCSDINEVHDLILAHVIVNIQETKDYAKRIFDKLENPKNLKEYKKARRLVREKYPKHTTYVENGLSYRCLTANMGVGTSKLKSVLRTAEEHGIVERKRHLLQLGWKDARILLGMVRNGVGDEYVSMTYGKGVRYFLTRNNAYLCLANTYIVHELRLEAGTGLEKNELAKV